MIQFRTRVFIDYLRARALLEPSLQFVANLEAARAGALQWAESRRATKEAQPDIGAGFFVGDLDAYEAPEGWGKVYTHPIGGRTFAVKPWLTPRETIGLHLDAGEWRFVVDWTGAERGGSRQIELTVIWDAAALHRSVKATVESFTGWLMPLSPFAPDDFTVSRLDLATDLQTDEVREDVLWRRLIVSRGRLRSYPNESSKKPAALADDDPEHPVRQWAKPWWVGHTFTGYEIGKRGRLFLRVYNKGEQVKARPEGKHVEDFWRSMFTGTPPGGERHHPTTGEVLPPGWYDASGSRFEPWDGEYGCVVGERKIRKSKTHPEGRTEKLIAGNVWRVEFEIQGEPLASLSPSIKKVYELFTPGRIESVWAYLTEDWCRIVEDDPAYDPHGPRDSRKRPLTGSRPEDRETQAWWRAVQLNGTIEAEDVTRAKRLPPFRKAAIHGHKAGLGYLASYVVGQQLDGRAQVELFRWLIKHWREAVHSKVRMRHDDAPAPLAFDTETRDRLLEEVASQIWGTEEEDAQRRRDIQAVRVIQAETDALNLLIAGELAKQLAAAGYDSLQLADQLEREQHRPKAPWTPQLAQRRKAR